jgi:hypothetical protein
MTLGNAAKAELRLIVWSRCCEHQFEPDSPNLRGGMVDIAAWLQCAGCPMPAIHSSIFTDFRPASC